MRTLTATGVIHGNTQSSGTVVRRPKGYKVLEFGASEGPDRQTKQQGSFSPSPQARGLARASARNTRTGGGRPRDRTNLCDGAIRWSAWHSKRVKQLTQRLRDPMRAIREDENEEDAEGRKPTLNVLLPLTRCSVGGLWGLDVGRNSGWCPEVTTVAQ
jgi:hypothetical protein